MALTKVDIATQQHKFRLECYYDFIGISSVKTNKALFLDMCKKGCRNFNNKYSCPPLSPEFSSYVKNNEFLLVVLLKIELSQMSGKNEYHKLRIGNAVIKPRLEKIMRMLEANLGSKFLSTGACRLCKPCQKKLGKPCKHPDKMRFSLESLGVDCNKLTEDLFKFHLLWYKDKKAPEYTAVVCALPLKNIDDKDRLFLLVDECIRKVVA
jgi:predicted metal-binding protein